ncbi:unnamed protein product, partial [Symbiodinium necroappetens]
WCIFEIAAFLHSRPKGKPGLQIVPPLLGPMLVGALMLIWAGCMAYTFIEAAVTSSEDSMLVGVYHLPVGGTMGLLFLSFVTHALRAYARSVDMLQKQLSKFKVEHTKSACCEAGHEENDSLCDRAIIFQSIAAWYGSLDSFELQVQSGVRTAVIDQLVFRALSYQRVLFVTTPYIWFELEYSARQVGDPILQIVELVQGFTYALAIFPMMDKLVFRLCYRWRERCCRRYLDWLLSMAIVILAFLFYIAVYTIQLYVFRQTERPVVLSVISMFLWWTVAAVLWRIT